MKRVFSCLTTLLFLAVLPAEANWPDRLEAQRQAFKDAWPAAVSGDRKPIDAKQALLADYPLYPDLQAAWLRTQVGKVNDREIDQFLASNSDGSMSNSLRYRWTRSLARRAQWQDYLAQYNASYGETTDQQFQCYALRARLHTGGDSQLAADALAFWLHGKSRPEECDPVFDWLESNGAITAELRRKRIELALENREFSLASWLARPLDAADQEQVQKWRRMRHRATQALQNPQQFADTEADRELVLYGIKRLARRDVEAATRLWSNYENRLSFEDPQRHRVARDLAYSAAQNYADDAIDRILAVDPAATDDKLIEWGVRAALRKQDWPQVIRIIDKLSADGRKQDRWQYWRARALEALGDATDARILYGKLAQGRGYYSFLAADRIEADYDYNHIPAVADDLVLGRLESQHGLVRAREMFFVDLHGRGRSEWERHVGTLTRDERAQSAILANRWGWHSVAISTASRSGLLDDLTLRYPIAFRETFEQRTAELDLPMTWAFGIARSESLFMPDVSSSAGALGIMQLMPATGRTTARQARIRYRGRPTLLDPQQNIALGTFYLDKMMARFNDHQVLSTAAYNAGPHRVDRWLPGGKPLAADIWVETVPYRETRHYVQRVLAADVIFHWRLTGETRRLAVVMPPVPVSPN